MMGGAPQSPIYRRRLVHIGRRGIAAAVNEEDFETQFSTCQKSVINQNEE